MKLCNRILASIVFLLSFTAIGAAVTADEKSDPQPNALTAEEQKAGWTLMFDGKSTDGWRSFKKDSLSEGWKAVDGTLSRAGQGAGDIIAKDKYGAFELQIDYKISPEGNSGIMYHVTEEEATPWMTGPEIQIQDNEKGHDPQKSGWLYQLYSSEKDATKPAGQWNHLRVVISPEKCEHYMNGVKYCEYVKGNKDWEEHVAKSKFGAMPKFGKATSGYIALQDHGNPVSYRNIKIRSLEKQ